MADGVKLPEKVIYKIMYLDGLNQRWEGDGESEEGEKMAQDLHVREGKVIWDKWVNGC